MRVFNKAIFLLLAAPLVCSAYEVNILDGRGAESRNLENGAYDVAIARLETRIQSEAADLDIALTNLCTAYVLTGEYEKAVPVCDDAVAANGRFVGVAYNSRGVLHALRGDFITALDDFAKAADDRFYPRDRSVWGDNAPSMARFAANGADVENSIDIAARNLQTADRVWATLQY